MDPKREEIMFEAWAEIAGKFEAAFKAVREQLGKAYDEGRKAAETEKMEMLLRCAVERLSEQDTEPKEPRLLTLTEIRALPDGTLLWEECRTDRREEYGEYETEIFVCEKWGTKIMSAGITTPITDELLQETDGITLRYWSARPTAEQRVSAKWER